MSSPSETTYQGCNEPSPVSITWTRFGRSQTSLAATVPVLRTQHFETQNEGYPLGLASCPPRPTITPTKTRRTSSCNTTIAPAGPPAARPGADRPPAAPGGTSICAVNRSLHRRPIIDLNKPIFTSGHHRRNRPPSSDHKI